MGLSQSSPQSSTEDNQPGGSFSIDSSGKIKPSRRRSTTTTTPDQADQFKVHPSDESTSPVLDKQQQQSEGGARSTPLATLNTMPANRGQDSVDLDEAEALVSRMKAKYKTNQTTEMAGKNRSVFEDVERDLIHCYKANKQQPLNCLKLSQEYNEYVRKQRGQLLNRSAVNVPLVTTILMILTCLALHLTAVHCYGVMSVDLGSEWMKVGLVAPSVPMDIVLNPQSQRKTAMAIAFSNGERYIGDSALDVASKYPERTYTHFLDLVGKTIEDESVKQYKQRFPYMDIVSHQPNSTSIVLNHPEDKELKLTPLELIAMMLQHAHDQVESRLNSYEPANDVVITVPPFFNDIERKVIRDAAKLVGLNVLRLTNVNSAFALSYGIFRHKDYQPEQTTGGNNANRTSILFFDQGASHTSATLADYHLVEQVDETTGLSKNESLPTVSIRAQVFDRYLGGFDMQLRLRDYLAKDFAESAKVDISRIYKRGRSASKLLKESGRVKRVLSANNDHLVRVENVIDDKDLRKPISRQEYELLNEDLLTERITSLLDRLFSMPNVDRDDRLESVIIVGGNTRTPKIQQVLLEYFKVDVLGKSVNADEGAALAALYQAASLGRGFRVKKFVLEEFGEERRRFDPAKVVTTTTTTPAPDTTVAADGATTESATTTTTAPTTEAPVTPDPNAIYSESELNRISKKLAHLREQDFLRMQRLSLSNSLESLLSEGREKLSSDDESLKEKRDEIQKLIAETREWLEEGPMQERDNVTILADKYTLIHDLINPKQQTTVPPPPSDSGDLYPDSVDLSKLFNNETLSILSKLNLTNPFAQSNDTNQSVDVENVTLTESSAGGEQENKSRVIPEPVEPKPPHSEL